MEKKDKKGDENNMSTSTEEQADLQVQEDLLKVREGFGVLEKYVTNKELDIENAIRLGKEGYLANKMKKYSED